MKQQPQIWKQIDRINKKKTPRIDCFGITEINKNAGKT